MKQLSEREWLELIAQQSEAAVRELLEVSGLRRGEILVIGCSSSEICGGVIGHASSFETAQTVYATIKPILYEAGVYLAAQCCEHLNRALIVERACAERYGLEEVCAVPQPKAGGSFATAAWQGARAPVTVERIRAHAGLDIGGTLIGMHLREVAVPVRLKTDWIGKASLLAARTRPRYIGGERTQYR